MTRALRQRTTVFVSYCHRNGRWLKRLQVHLKPYEHIGRLELWDDSRIRPGDEWLTEIRQAMERAAVAILLISPDFLASGFVVEEELPKLLAAAERGGARIIPIIVEPCGLSANPRLRRFQALNPLDQPLAGMSRTAAERVLVQAVEEIGRLLPPRDTAHDRGASSAGYTDEVDGVYDTLHAACVTSSILWCLAQHTPHGADGGAGANGAHGAVDAAGALSIGDLQRELRWRSRKSGVEALTTLVEGGWVEKTYDGDSTMFRLTVKGTRQIERLTATCDGPFARALGRAERPVQK